MIELVEGDILRDDSEALVNTVNCVGFMGRGIALQFKRAYPSNNREYIAAVRRGDVVPGRMLVHRTESLAGPKFVINLPNKRHWRGRSRLEDIDAGLEALTEVVREMRISSIAVPPLGCGLGGLDWAVVRPRIEAAFGPLPDVRVKLYAPSGAPANGAMVVSTDPPKWTPGRATLVALMASYLDGMMDASVSLLELHKLMYFMQEAGEPLRLTYTKATYGPYAENLRQVLVRIEGHLVAGYADGGDDPTKPLTIVPGAARDAEAFLVQHRETGARFARVAALTDGFATPLGMELLASVHWLVTKEAATSSTAILAGLRDWNARKRRFTEGQVQSATAALAEQGWITGIQS